MTLADHLLAVLLAVAIPFWVWARWPANRARLASGAAAVRLVAYWHNIAFLGALAAATLGAWAWSSRPWGGLGFTHRPGWMFWAALGGAAAIAALMAVQYAALARTAEGRRKLHDALGDMMVFMPRDRRELGHFAALALSAGIAEEIAYRGFLIWYVAQLAGASIIGYAIAILGSSVVFGLGHLYQGPGGAARIALVGVVAGTLYVLSGSLWIVIALHAYVDLAAGFAAIAASRDDPEREVAP